MEITKVNDRCRTICKILSKNKNAEPSIDFEGICTYCCSIGAIELERRLDSGEDAKWVEPLPGRCVDTVLVANSIRFNLNHLLDQPLTKDDYNRIVEKIEEKAGSMIVYMKELNKYFKE
jgi:hypothetical protein